MDAVSTDGAQTKLFQDDSMLKVLLDLTGMYLQEEESPHFCHLPTYSRLPKDRA